MARSSGAAAMETTDVLSPELVLVDPTLREAWQRLPDEPTPERYVAPATAVDDTAAAAARTLARIALDADVPPHRLRVRNVRALRVASGIAAAVAIAAIALLVADAAVDLSEPPAGAQGEQLAAAQFELPTDPVPEAAAPEQTPRAVTRAATTSAATARRFAWAPVEDATGYDVELFLDDARVFATSTTEAQVDVPDEWRFEGRRHELEAATYDWYVWPIVGGRRSAVAVVQATLVVRGR